MANTYELLASSTVGSGGASSISFTSIVATYSDLVLILSVRNTSANNYGSVLFNSSTTGYTRRILYGNGTTAYSTAPTGYESLTINPSDATSSIFANYEMYIPTYSGSNQKSFFVDAVTENNNNNAQVIFHDGLWANSAAINSLTITAGGGTNIAEHSTAYLYGIKSS